MAKIIPITSAPAVERRGCLRLRYLDTIATLQSDRATLIAPFRHLYQRFVEDDAESAARTLSRIELVLTAAPENSTDTPILRIDDEIWPIHNTHVLQEGAIYEIFLASILSRIRSHFLIHAAVAASHDRAVLIVGESGFGKSTLLLRLIRRGYSFLSDEVAPIDRATGRVAPFPRSLRVGIDSLERAGFHGPYANAIRWMEKLSVDIEDLRPGCLGNEAALSHVVFLHHGKEELAPRAKSSSREFSLLVDRLDHTLSERIRAIPDVLDLSVDEMINGFVLLKIRAKAFKPALKEIESLCRRDHVWIFDIIKRDVIPGDFSGPVTLEPISAGQAIIPLLRQFLPGGNSKILSDEFGDDSARLFAELAPLVSSAQFHRLKAGPIDDMADAICDLAPL